MPCSKRQPQVNTRWKKHNACWMKPKPRKIRYGRFLKGLERTMLNSIVHSVKPLQALRKPRKQSLRHNRMLTERQRKQNWSRPTLLKRKRRQKSLDLNSKKRKQNSTHWLVERRLIGLRSQRIFSKRNVLKVAFWKRPGPSSEK